MMLRKILGGGFLIIIAMAIIFSVNFVIQNNGKTIVGNCFDGKGNKIIYPSDLMCEERIIPVEISFLIPFLSLTCFATAILGGILGLQGLGVLRS